MFLAKTESALSDVNCSFLKPNVALQTDLPMVVTTAMLLNAIQKIWAG